MAAGLRSWRERAIQVLVFEALGLLLVTPPMATCTTGGLTACGRWGSRQALVRGCPVHQGINRTSPRPVVPAFLAAPPSTSLPSGCTATASALSMAP